MANFVFIRGVTSRDNTLYTCPAGVFAKVIFNAYNSVEYASIGIGTSSNAGNIIIDTSGTRNHLVSDFNAAYVVTYLSPGEIIYHNDGGNGITSYYSFTVIEEAV